jgi:hypothetical protein
MKLTTFVASLALALPVLTGCRTDEKLNAPPVLDPMFQRYVALGNSITAGFQSAGLSDSTQQRSFAALLALGMGTPFNHPTLNARGCPPPFVNNVTQARVGGGAATTCDLRIPVQGLLNNVAVPGNQVGNLLSNFGPAPSSFDPLKFILIGGRTELELMQQAQPTFVSVEIGVDDVLGAYIDLSNAGDTTQITPVAKFTAQYDSVADAISATGAKVVLTSVPNPMYDAFASPAAIYFCLKNGGCPAPLPPQDPRLALLPTFNVALNCAPPGGMNYYVQWPIALGKVDSAIAGAPTVLDCSVANQIIGPEEATAMGTAVAGYNAHIASVAAAKGWAYWDEAQWLANAKATGKILTFPNVNGAFLNPPTSILFGEYISLDGLHPSSAAHRVVADSLAAVINAKYGTAIPVPICGSLSCPSAQ